MVQAPLNFGLILMPVYQLPEMLHRITLADRSIGELRLFSGGYRTSFRTHDSLLPPSSPLNLHGRSTSLVCYIASIGEMLVQYARPMLWSYIRSYNGTCSQTFCSATSMHHFQAVDDTYGNGKLPWRSASCCCTVGSPVLFLAPTIEH